MQSNSKDRKSVPDCEINESTTGNGCVSLLSSLLAKLLIKSQKLSKQIWKKILNIPLEFGWDTYVDTFAAFLIIKRTITDFTNKLNSKLRTIKFNVEDEANNQLPLNEE